MNERSTKLLTNGYCSTVKLSFEEKLQVARDALKWVRDNHHEADGEFEQKVASALRETE